MIRGKRSRMEIDNADGDPADEAAMPTKEVNIIYIY